MLQEIPENQPSTGRQSFWPAPSRYAVMAIRALTWIGAARGVDQGFLWGSGTVYSRIAPG